MILYHYTCDHGQRALLKTGLVLPLRQHSPDAAAQLRPEWQCMAGLAWFTDLDWPFREALGLTSLITPCDRTRYRWQVVNQAGVQAWLISEHRQRWPQLRRLEREPNVLPRHWFVASGPVAVVFDPL
jgi:hypothetical protein